MKFVHMADVHFGNSFASLQGKSNFIQKRLLAQKSAFDKTIEYIKNNNIEHFFIAGDLFEQDVYDKSIVTQSVEYCNKKFNEIPNTKVWIAPGNHDPYIKNSYYQSYHWTNNVTIFKNCIECYNLEEAIIYGFGFGDFYENNSHIEELSLQDKNKLNILVTHGDLDGNKNTQKSYNPIVSRKLSDIGFDYVALRSYT